MRALLSLVGLLVVVYVVVQLARTQLQAIRPSLPATATPDASAPAPQQQLVDELNKALELGRQRAASTAE